MAAARSDDGRDVGLGLVAGQEARRGQQQRLGRVDRGQELTARTSQRDVATVEPLQWQAELESGCEQGQVVVGGQGAWRVASFWRRGPWSGRSLLTVRNPGSDAVEGTMKTSLPTGLVCTAARRGGTHRRCSTTPRRRAGSAAAGAASSRSWSGCWSSAGPWPSWRAPSRPPRRQPGAGSRRGRGQPAAERCRRSARLGELQDPRGRLIAGRPRPLPPNPASRPRRRPDAAGRRDASPATSGRCRHGRLTLPVRPVAVGVAHRRRREVPRRPGSRDVLRRSGSSRRTTAWSSRRRASSTPRSAGSAT